jgi:hypothetical protein
MERSSSDSHYQYRGVHGEMTLLSSNRKMRTLSPDVGGAETPISVDLLRALERSDDRPQEWTLDDEVRAIDRYTRFLKLAAKHMRSFV